MEYFVLWFLFAFFSALIATSKGRSGANWFFAGLLFGPFGLLVAALPSVRTVAAAVVPVQVLAETRPCPLCAELVLFAAIKCKHCGSEIQSQPLPRPAQAAAKAKPKRAMGFGEWVLVILLGCIALGAGVSQCNRDQRVVAAPIVIQPSDCEARGVAYFKEIDSFPRLSDGRLAVDVARERCARTDRAF